MDDLGALPHAVATLGQNPTLPERALDQLGLKRRVQVSTSGWLSLPFVIAGTDMVAVIPERLARQAAASARVAVVEPPFGEVELIEAVWWHPSRSADPGHQWLLSLLRQVAAGLREG